MTVQNVSSVKEAHLWGRAWNATISSTLGSVFLFLTAPLMVLYFYISAFYFDCSLSAPIEALFSQKLTINQLLALLPD